jgi:glutaconate CoA-transferase subunit B
MADYTNYTNKEIQAVNIAKCIHNDQIVIVGTGLPLIGASLAKRVYAPKCHLIVESGLMDCSPIEVPRSVGDARFMAHCAVQWPNIRFIGFEANEWLHNEDRLIAFIGGAQIDPFGNVNSTSIGDYHHPKTRFTGSGGREAHGLPGNRGPQMVVTDRGILKFDKDTKRMYLAGYYPSSSPEEIIENTGFDIDVSKAVKLDAPDPEVIRMIREEIDPGQAFIKVPVEEKA